MLFADGRPAPRAYVWLEDGAVANGRQVAVGIKTTNNGTFSFLVHEGLDYMATASYRDENAQRWVQGRVGPFRVKGETPPISVVLSEGR